MMTALIKISAILDQCKTCNGKGEMNPLHVSLGGAIPAVIHYPDTCTTCDGKGVLINLKKLNELLGSVDNG